MLAENRQTNEHAPGIRNTKEVWFREGTRRQRNFSLYSTLNREGNSWTGAKIITDKTHQRNPWVGKTMTSTGRLFQEKFRLLFKYWYYEVMKKIM
jgi:hypothetical protein